MNYTVRLIKNQQDFEGNGGQLCDIIGTYTEVDVRKKNTEPAVYNGHVAIVLEDGSHIYLEPAWSKEAIRDAAEIEKYKDKKVAVIGIFLEHTPSPPEPMAYFNAPCVYNGASVVDLETYKLLNDEINLDDL